MIAPVDVATLRELARSDGLSPATAGRLLDRLEALERVADAAFRVSWLCSSPDACFSTNGPRCSACRLRAAFAALDEVTRG